ncbi:hypothetical protein OG689_40075 [Kitasatospora sp. NBC_00240]|nr:hypothetical protein [Kitasatospora sp. NBC_00240]MCX5215378.1 hypothetical protein [Kitasatospora sp. NBC_00240]
MLGKHVSDVTKEKWGWKATAHRTRGKPSGLAQFQGGPGGEDADRSVLGV